MMCRDARSQVVPYLCGLILAVAAGCAGTDEPPGAEGDTLNIVPREVGNGPGGDTGAGPDTAEDPAGGRDTGVDSGGADTAGADSAMPEAGRADTGASDTGRDTWTMSDTGRDTAADAGTDSGMNGGMDSGMDTMPDTARDTTADSGIDTSDTNPGPTAPGPGEVVVTEFMASPDATSHSKGEYFELTNTSAGTPYELDGCVIRDKDVDSHGIAASGGSLVIPAGGRLTLANSTTPGFRPDYVYGSGWYLSGGDEIVLECNATVVDAVDYSGWQNGPTDGAARGLDPDEVDAQAASANDSAMHWCDQTSSLPGNTDLGTPGAKNDACSGGGGTTRPKAPSAAGDLVITEFMASPDDLSDSKGEYFELYNPGSSTPRELNGCVIADKGQDSHTVAPTSGSLVVKPGQYVALAKSASPGFTPDYVYPSNWYLSDDDEIVLKCGGTVIDEVDYAGGPNWGGNGPAGGAAKGLEPMTLDAAKNDDAKNWCDQTTGLAMSADKGTPGAANDACGP